MQKLWKLHKCFLFSNTVFILWVHVEIVERNHVNARLSQRRDEQKLHSQRQQRVIRLTEDFYDQSLHKGIIRGKEYQDDC